MSCFSFLLLSARRADLIEFSMSRICWVTLDVFSSYFTLWMAERDAKTLEMIFRDGRLDSFVSLPFGLFSGSYV